MAHDWAMLLFNVTIMPHKSFPNEVKKKVSRHECYDELPKSISSLFFLLLFLPEKIYLVSQPVDLTKTKEKITMQWIILKWIIKFPTTYKIHRKAWRFIWASNRIKMIEPSNSTNATNATDYYMNEEFTEIVSISVFISFSFIFLVGLLGNSLVVMGEHLKLNGILWC